MLGIPDGDAMVVIAANFGKTTHPAWYHNVRTTPTVEVAVDGVSRQYRATELEGAERDHWFAQAVELNPGWLRYRTWASARAIPVVRLTPLAARLHRHDCAYRATCLAASNPGSAGPVSAPP